MITQPLLALQPTQAVPPRPSLTISSSESLQTSALVSAADLSAADALSRAAALRQVRYELLGAHAPALSRRWPLLPWAAEALGWAAAHRRPRLRLHCGPAGHLRLVFAADLPGRAGQSSVMYSVCTVCVCLQSFRRKLVEFHFTLMARYVS